MGPVFKQQMDEIAAYNGSKLLSSIVIVLPPPLKIIERGVNITLNFGSNKVRTYCTATFLSAACFSDIIVINI
jgi:hypothetical protein